MTQTRLYLTARKPEAMHIGTILDPLFEEDGIPTVLFEDDAIPGNWVWSVYVDTDKSPQTRAAILDRLGGDGFSLEIDEETLGDIDWVAETLRELKPVEAGRFFIHGSHDRARAAHHRLPVEIDAGLAFGTGHHGTTAGCLDMLEWVLRRTKPKKAYDVGTGSGVLAIALAKATHIDVLATDIDPVATGVAAENARKNGGPGHIKAVTATGFEHPAFNAFGKADLVLANILAKPLEGLAFPMRQHLERGAYVILSGLLPHQQSRIVSAYRLQGLILRKADIRDGWLSLILQRP